MLLTRKQQLYVLVILFAVTFVVIYYFTDTSSKAVGTFFVKEYDSSKHLFQPTVQKLMNITLKYNLNNQHICNDTGNILAVIIVTSYFGNVETRNSMRSAFDNNFLEKNKLRRVFLLGEAEDKYTTQQSIINESWTFEDIIQGNFTEAYKNLTYKHLMGLRWAGTYCSNAKYVVKMDDDTVVNMYELSTILNNLHNISDREFIAGYKLSNMKPIRDPTNKWYVTKNQYPGNNYPTFVSGWFYATNPQTALKIAIMANYDNFFWIDDLFITGVLAKKLKIVLYDISKYFVVNAEYLQCCLQDFSKNIDCDYYLGPNGGDNEMFFKFNEKVKKCAVDHLCTKRKKPLNETCVAERKVNLGIGDPVVNDFRLF